MEEELTFEFDWSVEGFSTFKDSDYTRTSPTFEGPTSEYSWKLEMMRKRLLCSDEYYVGLYLNHTGDFPKSQKLKASCQFSLRDREGKLVNQKALDDKKRTDFNVTSRRGSLFSYEELPKVDTLTFHVSLRIDAKPSLRANHVSALADFGRLMREAGDLFADLDIVTDTKTFKAHKNILSVRSKVFAAMFTTPMAEAYSGSLEISDFDEDTVKGMLEYVYTGQVVDLMDPSRSRSLLQISEKYELHGLKKMVEASIVNTLTVGNSVDTLILAQLVNASFIKSRTTHFINGNKNAVTQTDAFKRLGKSNPTARTLTELICTKVCTGLQRSHGGANADKAFNDNLVPASRLLRDGNFTDVTIFTKTKSFKAHKLILSVRSKVFAAMFITSIGEAAPGSLKIEDFEDDTVDGMLEYIYTGQVVNLNVQAQSLLKIADKFKLQGLKAVAADSILQSLSVDNARDVLALADLTNAKFLKSHAIQFIHGNKEEVSKTKAFQLLGESNPTAGALMELYLGSEQ